MVEFRDVSATAPDSFRKLGVFIRNYLSHDNLVKQKVKKVMLCEFIRVIIDYDSTTAIVTLHCPIESGAFIKICYFRNGLYYYILELKTEKIKQ